MGFFSRNQFGDPFTMDFRNFLINTLRGRIGRGAPQFPGKLDDRFNAQIPDILKQVESVLSGRLETPTIDPGKFVDEKVRGDFFNALNSELERGFGRERDLLSEQLAGANLLTSGPGFEQFREQGERETKRSGDLKSIIEKEALDRFFQATALREDVIGRDIGQATGLGEIFLESDERALDRALRDFERQQAQELAELGLGTDFFSQGLVPFAQGQAGIEDELAGFAGEALGGFDFGELFERFGGQFGGEEGGGGAFGNVDPNTILQLVNMFGGGGGGAGGAGAIKNPLTGQGDVSGGFEGGGGFDLGSISNLLGGGQGGQGGGNLFDSEFTGSDVSQGLQIAMLLAQFAAMFCWVGATVFKGWFKPKTIFARFYMQFGASKKLRYIYSKYGKSIAAMAKKDKKLRAQLKPAFEEFARRGARMLEVNYGAV